jgi:hypothetical protein
MPTVIWYLHLKGLITCNVLLLLLLFFHIDDYSEHLSATNKQRYIVQKAKQYIMKTKKVP